MLAHQISAGVKFMNFTFTFMPTHGSRPNVIEGFFLKLSRHSTTDRPATPQQTCAPRRDQNKPMPSTRTRYPGDLVLWLKRKIHPVVLAEPDPWACSPWTSSVGIRALPARPCQLPWMPGTSPGMDERSLQPQCIICLSRRTSRVEAVKSSEAAPNCSRPAGTKSSRFTDS